MTTFETLRAFADLFSTSLYDTGFSEPIRESGLAKVQRREEAFRALTWLQGYANAMAAANRALQQTTPDLAEVAAKQEKVCEMLELTFYNLAAAVMRVYESDGHVVAHCKAAVDKFTWGLV